MLNLVIELPSLTPCMIGPTCGSIRAWSGATLPNFISKSMSPCSLIRGQVDSNIFLKKNQMVTYGLNIVHKKQ